MQVPEPLILFELLDLPNARNGFLKRRLSGIQSAIRWEIDC